MSHTRRRFLQQSATVGAGAAMMPLATASAFTRRQQVAPSDRIVVGVIGCNGQGWANLQAMLRTDGVECGALCDVDQRVLDRRVTALERSGARRPELYGDFRELLDNQDIDAVIIGTPDHWHCLQMVMACEAGKDVYVEKPLANSIEEANVMVAAARRYDRVVQVGQWQRSGVHWDEAIEFVRSGQLGRIRTVRAWAYMDWMDSVPVAPDGPAPEGVDYDMWLGPAPSRPFNENRFHFTFRWFWDYAGGLMTDWGVHLIDMALAGMNGAQPTSVVATGGKFAYPDDAQETPDTMQTIYEFDGFSMIWEHAVGIALGPFQRDHGVAFIGNNGTLVVDRQKWQIFPEATGSGADRTYKIPARPIRTRSGRGELDRHTENFIECMRTREEPRCPVEIGRDVAVTAHLGNIAYRTDSRVSWDSQAGRFVDNPAADALIRASYRGPWQVPRV